MGGASAPTLFCRVARNCMATWAKSVGAEAPPTTAASHNSRLPQQPAPARKPGWAHPIARTVLTVLTTRHCPSTRSTCRVLYTATERLWYALYSTVPASFDVGRNACTSITSAGWPSRARLPLASSAISSHWLAGSRRSLGRASAVNSGRAASRRSTRRHWVGWSASASCAANTAWASARGVAATLPSNACVASAASAGSTAGAAAGRVRMPWNSARPIATAMHTSRPILIRSARLSPGRRASSASERNRYGAWWLCSPRVLSISPASRSRSRARNWSSERITHTVGRSPASSR
ncbi:DUF6053 domain-containing protein [Lysobacter enzymogenes]|uniref:DUF6053 domain-containing protein n=1 Tax=Lysobacter enzymogenes TaxID=69 RepID=UPI003D2F6417